MSRFHDELVARRRRPDAGEPEPPAADAAPVVFLPVDAEPVVCGRCGAAVPESRAELHADWHGRLGD